MEGEDPKGKGKAPIQSIHNDGFIRSFDHAVFKQSVEPSAPPSRSSGPSAQLDTTTTHQSTPSLSNSESPLSDIDPRTFQLDNSADLESSSIPDNSNPRGRNSKRTASFAKGKVAKKAKGNEKAEDVEKLLSNPKSGIYKKDFNLKSVLLHEKALSALPQGSSSFSQLPSQEMNSAIASFKEDGRGGRHDSQWARQALNASARRAAGEFDSYEASKFQDNWAEEIEYLTDSDDSSNVEIIIPSKSGCAPSSNHNQRRHDEDDEPSKGSGSKGTNGSSNLSSHGTYCNTSQTASNHSPSNGHANDSGPAEGSDPLPPAPKSQIALIAGDGKLEVLFRTCPFVAQPVIQAGDVIRLRESNIDKKIIIKAFHRSQSQRNSVDGSLNQFAYLEIAIPPKGYAVSEPHLRDDIIFPNETLNTWITGVAQVYHAMQNVEPSVRMTHVGSWDNYEIYRNDKFLGSVFDLRQAWHFAKNEHDFRRQLSFERGRQRRLHRTQQEDGYHIFQNSGLYRKVRAIDCALQNGSLVIDLGEELNGELAACAEAGSTILMYDYRILINDGIPIPRDATLEEVYKRGPEAFTTPYTRAVASFAGWTKGHAHIGPLGLGKGWNGPQWSKGRGRPEGALERGARGHSWRWLDLQNIRYEECPPGRPWTKLEVAAVSKFHETEIFGKIRHSPLPRTRVPMYPGVTPRQLRYEQDPNRLQSVYPAIHKRPKQSSQPDTPNIARQATSAGSRAGPSHQNHVIPAVSLQTSIPRRSSYSTIDVPPLRSEEALFAMAAMFKKDPRRSSTSNQTLKFPCDASVELQQVPPNYYIPYARADGGPFPDPFDPWQEPGPLVATRDHIRNAPYRVAVNPGPANLSRNEDHERKAVWEQDIPPMPYLTGDAGVKARSEIKEFAVIEDQLGRRPWHEYTSAPAARTSLVKEYPQNDSDEAAQRWPFKNADNPYSQYPEIPREYLLERDTQSEEEHGATAQDAAYSEFGTQFDDAPYPPPVFRSYFGTYDGFCDDRDYSPSMASVDNSQAFSSEPETSVKSIIEKVEATVINIRSEDESALLSVKAEPQDDWVTTKPEFAKHREREFSTIKTPARPQPTRTCKPTHLTSTKTEDSRSFLSAAEYSKLPTIPYSTQFAARSKVGSLRFCTPTEMARYQTSGGSPNGEHSPLYLPGHFMASPSLAASFSNGSFPDDSASGVPAAAVCLPAALYDSSNSSNAPAAGSFPDAPHTPSRIAPGNPFVITGHVPSLVVPPPAAPMVFQAANPLLWDSEFAGFLPDGTFVDNTRYASPNTAGRVLGSSVPLGHAAVPYPFHQTTIESNITATPIPSKLLCGLSGAPALSAAEVNHNVESASAQAQVAVEIPAQSILTQLQRPKPLPFEYQGQFYHTYSEYHVGQMKQELTAEVPPTIETASSPDVTTQEDEVTTNEDKDPFTDEAQVPNATAEHSDDAAENDDPASSTYNLTLEEQQAFIASESHSAIWFDKERRPEGTRSKKHSETDPPSPLKSNYPDPEGFLSLPHYPTILLPISTSSPAPALAPLPPVVNQQSPKRKAGWNNGEHSAGGPAAPATVLKKRK